jgi:hypothetical protein
MSLVKDLNHTFIYADQFLLIFWMEGVLYYKNEYELNYKSCTFVFFWFLSNQNDQFRV